MWAWIEEIQEAVNAIAEVAGDYTLAVTKIVPCLDGVVFETEKDDVHYKWYSTDGHIEKHLKSDWRNKNV